MNKKPTTRMFRITLIGSLVAGALAIYILPPELYFRWDRLWAGLPQQYFGFDPARFLEGAPPRTPLALAVIISAKFLAGVVSVWIVRFIIRYVKTGTRSDE
jgi:hypothetical protein